jgi:hypothetical protein
MSDAPSFDERSKAGRSLPPVWSVPIVAAFVFVGLYATAAVLYPGGTYQEPSRSGYSFVDNYFCDLLDAQTKAGRGNAGRPVAIAAMVVLCVGISVFWWSVPKLFPGARVRAAVVRASGLASGLVTPWVATRAHDAVIHGAGLLGVIGFVGTMTAPGAHRTRTVEVAAWTAIAFVVANYLIWVTRVGLAWMALVQKGAFSFFLLWMVLVALRLRGPRAPFEKRGSGARS